MKTREQLETENRELKQRLALLEMLLEPFRDEEFTPEQAEAGKWGAN